MDYNLINLDNKIKRLESENKENEETIKKIPLILLIQENREHDIYKIVNNDLLESNKVLNGKNKELQNERNNIEYCLIYINTVLASSVLYLLCRSLYILIK